MDDHNKKKNKSEESEAFMTPPSQMYFQLLSNKENNSNVITLCISGFLSGDEDKSSQWVDLLHSCSGTVIGLHWNCSETKEFFSTVAQNLVPQIFSKFNAVGVALSAVSFLTQNPYEKASKEAERVGKYLAYLIAEYKLFGNRQINIICHSLGSVIVLECIKELDKLYEKKKQQFINEIMIMGGVADIFKLQKRRWNAVAGRIYNTYSKNDQILKYVLQIAKVFDSPCGIYNDLAQFQDQSPYIQELDGIFIIKNLWQNIKKYLNIDNKFQHSKFNIIQNNKNQVYLINNKWQTVISQKQLMDTLIIGIR